MYNETLEEFYKNISIRINKLNKYKIEKDMNNYSIEVHALKSDARYLGFMKLADIALKHELESKANNIEFIESEYNNLFNKVNEVYNISKKNLGK